MVNDLISHPSSETDKICNDIIAMSDAFSKAIGLSYSELWILIMVSVCIAIGYYMTIACGALYSKHRTFFKFMFWGSFIAIAILVFITMNVFAYIYVRPE
jgi:hypothetical protein